MEFLDIASLGASYRYIVKIEKKFKQKRQEFGSTNTSHLKQGNNGTNKKTRDKENMAALRTTSPSHNPRRVMRN
jgi:hypothetical protein